MRSTPETETDERRCGSAGRSNWGDCGLKADFVIVDEASARHEIYRTLLVAVLCARKRRRHWRSSMASRAALLVSLISLVGIVQHLTPCIMSSIWRARLTYDAQRVRSHGREQISISGLMTDIQALHLVWRGVDNGHEPSCRARHVSFITTRSYSPTSLARPRGHKTRFYCASVHSAAAFAPPVERGRQMKREPSPPRAF
jgi:hypothetical protein